VRAQGLKFGLSNHGIENFQFINPPPALAEKLKAEHADLYDPKWADFYHVADRSDAACEKFLVDWYDRNVELIDKYRPAHPVVRQRRRPALPGPLKLRVAAYFYNRAAEWGKEVSLSAKKAAFAPSGTNTQTIGSIIDFEKIGPRSPAGIRTGAWLVDHPIGSTWGYTSDMRVSGPEAVLAGLADTVSKNGTFLLNVSPRADGTIPEAQQATLRARGAARRRRTSVPPGRTRARRHGLHFSQLILISFSTALNSGSPVTSSAFLSLARAAAKQSP
jgi:alpha-L-fucosidase